jgi:iron complex transport system substrate-binding protein
VVKKLSPPIALGLALVAVSALVARMTPVDLLRPPERPFAGYGNREVRLEGASYPRHATGADDVRMTIARPARRIVTQQMSADEYVYAIAPPEHVVGVSDTAYERRISNVYEQAERFHPAIALDPERALYADPDLVFSPAGARADLPSLLRRAGLPVYRLHTMPSTLADIAAHIRLTGYLTGEDARADAELRRFEDVVRRAAARRPANAPRPRVLGLGGRYSYGSETLFHDIIRTLGGINLAAEHGLRGYDAINEEHIIRWNPQWIIAGADRGTTSQALARLLANPAIAGTDAAKRGQILVVEHHVFLPLSPYTSLLIQAIADAIYPQRDAERYPERYTERHPEPRS